MACCENNKNNNISNEAWDVIKKMPFFRYFKQPVDTVAQLYEKYPDGNEKYSFSYVYNERRFYSWNFEDKEWVPTGGADMPDIFFVNDIDFSGESDALKMIACIKNISTGETDSFEKQLPAATQTKWGVISPELYALFTSVQPYILPAASPAVLGGIKVGANLSIDANGVLSGSTSYTLPAASATNLGGVKVGTNLSIDGDGVLSAQGIQDAPSDGNFYVRRNGAWVQLPTTASGVQVVTI